MAAYAQRQWAPPKPSFDSPKPRYTIRSTYDAWIEPTGSDRRLPRRAKRLPPRKVMEKVDPILQNVYLEEMALENDIEADSLERMWNWSFQQPNTAKHGRHVWHESDRVSCSPRQRLSPFSPPSCSTPRPEAHRRMGHQPHPSSESQSSDTTSCQSFFDAWDTQESRSSQQSAASSNGTFSLLSKQWPKIIGKNDSSSNRLFKAVNRAAPTSAPHADNIPCNDEVRINMPQEQPEQLAEGQSGRRLGAYLNTLRLPAAPGLGLRGASGPPVEDERKMKEALFSANMNKNQGNDEGAHTYPQIRIDSYNRTGTPQQVLLPFNVKRRPRAPFPLTLSDTARDGQPYAKSRAPEHKLVRPIPLKAAALLGAAPKSVLPLAASSAMPQSAPRPAPPSVLAPPANILPPCPDRMNGLNALVRPKPLRPAKLSAVGTPCRPPRPTQEDLFEDLRTPTTEAVTAPPAVILRDELPLTPHGWTSEKPEADRATADSPIFEAQLIDASFHEVRIDDVDDAEVQLEVGGMTFATQWSLLCPEQVDQHGGVAAVDQAQGIHAWLQRVHADLLNVERDDGSSARSPSPHNLPELFQRKVERNTVNSLCGSYGPDAGGSDDESSGSSRSSLNESPPLASPTEPFDFRLSCLRDVTGAQSLMSKADGGYEDDTELDPYDRAAKDLWDALRRSNQRLQTDHHAKDVAQTPSTKKTVRTSVKSVRVLLPPDRNPLYYPIILFALKKGALPAFFSESCNHDAQRAARSALKDIRQESAWLGCHTVVALCDRYMGD